MPTVKYVCVLVAMCAILSCREKALAATGDCGGQAAVDWSVGGALGSICSPHIFLTPHTFLTCTVKYSCYNHLMLYLLYERLATH